MADDEDALARRRQQLSQKRGGTGPFVWILGTIVFLFVGAIILVPEQIGQILGLGASKSEQIQKTSRPDNSGLSTQLRPRPQPEIEQPQIVIRPAPETPDRSAEYLKRIEELQEQIEALANKPATPTGISQEQMTALLDAQEARLRADAEAKQAAHDAELQAKLAAMEEMIAAGQTPQPFQPTGPSAEELAEQERQRRLEEERQRRLAELERRRAELEAARAAREAELEERRKSDANIFDESREGETSGTQEGQTGIQESRANGIGSNRRRQTENESFLSQAAGAGDTRTVRARDLSDTSRLIVQGTIITAILETAVDTELPGNMRAMVNSPVYSYDGSEVLMPAGTRLIGTYNSDISLAQKRVLIAWNRAITPEGKSVTLASTGVDRLGRGGQNGNVDNRFLERFGSAALVSTISGIPRILSALAGAEDVSESTEAATGVGEDIGDDLSDATEDVVQEYLSLPPVIRIPQGTLVKVLVNQDLDFR